MKELADVAQKALVPDAPEFNKYEGDEGDGQRHIQIVLVPLSNSASPS